MTSISAQPAPMVMSSGIRILIADDDDDARAMIGDLLTAHGHQVVSQVDSGRAAVEAARELLPDAVLLDIHMPDGSGIEAAEQITAFAPRTAVILFSGDPLVTLSDDQVNATSAIAFLPKPTPPRILDSTIRLAVSRARDLTSARGDATAAKQQLENRKTIERAKGILMRRTGGSEQEAYRILQRTSQDRSVPMVEIAKAVLASEPGLKS